MRVLDANGAVVWDSADPNAGPLPPPPIGGSYSYLNMGGTPKAQPPKSAMDYYLGPTGIPDRLRALNQTFNPLESVEQSMTASDRLFAPETSGWGRVEATGDMLSGMAGFLAPMVAGNAMGKPAAAVLEDTLLPIGADFWADESGAMKLPFQGDGFTAYHGSPHDFDKFDMSKIGTGEGAQAYGHGLYFAEREGIARNYRDQLTKPFIQPSAIGIKFKGIDISPYDDAYKKGELGTAARAIAQSHGDIDSAISGLRRWGDRRRKDIADWIVRNRSDFEISIPESGRMYEVRINADPNDFLDWDKPLSEQPQAVRDALAERANLQPGDENIPAKMLYLSEGKQAGTERLRRLGIPGIKYLDAGSRSAGDGSRNYVVFDADLIEIVRKYGVAGAAAMLGMSAADLEGAMAGTTQDSPLSQSHKGVQK